jgi:hypothetical protein
MLRTRQGEANLPLMKKRKGSKAHRGVTLVANNHWSNQAFVTVLAAILLSGAFMDITALGLVGARCLSRAINVAYLQS